MTVHNPPPAQSAPIPCGNCMRTFSRRPDLIRHHREVHENEKFLCGYHGCDYSSTRKDRTRKHRESKHPGAFTQITELNTDNTVHNQGQAHYPNSQTSGQDYSSSFQSQPNQTYNEYYSTPESADSATYTTPGSHSQQIYYSSPNPSMSSYQPETAGSSYGNDWEGAPQEQWNNGNGSGQGFA